MSNDKTFQLLKRFTCHGFYTITEKYKEQSAILSTGVNMAALRIVIIVRIPEFGNLKNHRFLQFFLTRLTRLKGTRLKYRKHKRLPIFCHDRMQNRKHFVIFVRYCIVSLP